nr:MAG TPA: hypothetical protein [Caudoviricetes sp.]
MPRKLSEMMTMSNKTRNRTQTQGVKLLAESQMSWSTIGEFASSALGSAQTAPFRSQIPYYNNEGCDVNNKR